MQVPAAKVAGVASFYHFFRLKPRGRFMISVCLGTACYVKGADRIAEKIMEELGISWGETSKDGVFTLEARALPRAPAAGAGGDDRREGPRSGDARPGPRDVGKVSEAGKNGVAGSATSRSGLHDHADFRRCGQRRPVRGFQLVAGCPLLPDARSASILMKIPPTTGRACMPPLRTLSVYVGIGQRIAGGGLVRDNRRSAKRWPRSRPGSPPASRSRPTSRSWSAACGNPAARRSAA